MPGDQSTNPRRKTAQNAEKLPQWPDKLVGAKYVRMLDKHLRCLRQDGQHGNRELFLDDVFVVYLLAFFNPTIRSLRTIEDVSQTQQAQEHLAIRKICKSTLSDFNRLVDPQRLDPIIAALRAQLADKQVPHRGHDADLNSLLEQTIAVDGTFLHAVADVAWAVANSNNHDATRHRARLDAHLNVSTWLPETIVVPDPGESESDSAIRHIQSGNIYVYDRGYTGFALLKAHYQDDAKPCVPKAHFVVRYKREGKNSPTLANTVDRPLTNEDRDAGVVSDRVGNFTSSNACRVGVALLPLREVVVTYEAQGETKTLRLITNLMGVSAKTIALLYQHRWQVELFFRWFKSIGNLGHLISHSQGGVLTHLYVTIIATMLMYLHTGYRPSKYMFALLSQVAAGAASLEEIIPILRERERRNELDRQSAARRREKKQAASN